MSFVRGPLTSSDIPEGYLVSGVYNSIPPSPGDTQGCALQLDNLGNLKVNLASGSVSIGTVKIEDTSGNPITATAGSLNVNITGGSSSGVQYVDGTAESSGAFTGTVAMSWNGTAVVGLRSDASDNLYVNLHTALPAGTNLIGAANIEASGTALTATGSSLNVNITGGSSGNAAASATGSAVPADADYGGLNVGGTLRGQTGVNPSGSVYAGQMDLSSVGGTTFALGQQLATASLPIVLTAAQIITLTPLSTVAVTQSTSPWIVAGGGTAGSPGTAVLTVQGIGSGTPVPVSGTITFPASPVVWIEGHGGAVVDGVITAATAPANGLAVLGVYNSSLPTLTTGQSAAIQVDASGQQLVDLNYYAGVALGAAANYGTSPGAVKVAGVNAFVTNTVPVSLGSGAIFEVSPTTAANTVSNTFFTQVGDGTHAVTLNSTTYTSKYGLDTNLLGTLGTAFTTAGFVDIKGADGNVFVRQTTAANLNATVVGTGTFATQSVVTQGTAANLNATVVPGGSAIFEVSPTTAANTKTNPFFTALTDGTNVITAAISAWGTAPTGTEVQGVNANLFIAGTISATAASGVQKVGIVGNAGGAVDAATNATPPANALQVGQVGLTTLPTAVTSGNIVAPLADTAGRTITRSAGPRERMVVNGITITASTGSTSLIAAGASGVFRDLTFLQGSNSSATNSLLTISDGTVSYIWFVAANGGGFNINFDPPLKATTAATAWTATCGASISSMYVSAQAAETN